MAQFSGGSDFDVVWEEWSNASLRFLREAANAFAKSVRYLAGVAALFMSCSNPPAGV